jgi:pyruvate dehydrogenase E1 component beta subunit
MDMPSSENAMTGICLGAAMAGLRPVMVHMRFDFAVLAMEPLVNQAAKWHYMYGGALRSPLTVRVIVGRGWGQGPQHSQSLQAWLAHVPGLRVMMPATPADAKGMLMSAIEGDTPTILVEHRWLFNLHGAVPAGRLMAPLSGARIARQGRDVSIVATSYMVVEALAAASMLSSMGIEAEVVDLRMVAPLDVETILASVRRTGRIIVADTGHTAFGIGAEVVSLVAERALGSLKAAPARLGLPAAPTPATPALADLFYPRAIDIARIALEQTGSGAQLPPEPNGCNGWRDGPDPSFTGPY